MAFRKKAKYLQEYDADILVIQESENLGKLDIPELKDYTQRIWMGKGPNKGLLVLAKAGYKLRVCDYYTELYKYVVPIEVTGNDAFTLMTVWALDNPIKRSERYIGQVWLALQEYTSHLQGPVIMIGDFNSNKIWDKKHRGCSHSDVVALLKQLGISSLYHWLTGEEQGCELTPTYVFWRDLSKGFHIDYCFVSESLLNGQAKLEVLPMKEWITRSDHAPLVMDVEF